VSGQAHPIKLSSRVLAHEALPAQRLSCIDQPPRSDQTARSLARHSAVRSEASALKSRYLATLEVKGSSSLTHFLARARTYTHTHTHTHVYTYTVYGPAALRPGQGRHLPGSAQRPCFDARFQFRLPAVSVRQQFCAGSYVREEIARELS
jgi:hypothetical protein